MGAALLESVTTFMLTHARPRGPPRRRLRLLTQPGRTHDPLQIQMTKVETNAYASTRLGTRPMLAVFAEAFLLGPIIAARGYSGFEV